MKSQMSCILLVSTNDENPALVRGLGQLALALRANGFRVVVQSSLDANSPFEKLEGIAVLPMKKHPIFGASLGYSVRGHISNGQVVDVVHVMGFDIHTLDVFTVCQKLEVATVLHVDEESALDIKKVPFLKRNSYLESLKAAGCLVVNSKYLEQKVKALGLNNVFYIPLGVRADFFKPVLSKRPMRRKLGLPESTTIVCCMADILPENKQLDILKVCEPLGSWLHLLFVGRVRDPMYLEEIKAQIQKMNAESFVLFRNTVDNPEEYLKAIDVFMLLGGVERRVQTVLEAMSSGAPVVLGASPSSEMLTDNGESGFVLGDGKALASPAVERLLLEPSFRQGRSMKARDFVLHAFDFKKSVEKYMAVYEGVMRNSKASVEHD